MLEQHFGFDWFRVGVRVYLVAHAYGNIEMLDLWDVIELVTQELVCCLMDSWIW